MTLSRQINETRYGVTALVLFLFVPFLGFLRACGRLHNRLCEFVVMMFYGLFGYAHSFFDVRADAYRKAVAFTRMRGDDFTSIWEAYLKGELPDPAERVIYSIVGKFTDNPHIMMGVIGFVGSFFIALTFRKIIGNYKYPKSLAYVILIYTLVIFFSPLAIGGIRQYLLLGLVSYSILNIICDRKYIWFVGLAVAPLLHFSALLWLPLVAIFVLVRIPKSWLFWAAISACVIGNIVEASGYRQMISSVVDEYGDENKAIRDKANFYSSAYAERQFNKSKTTNLMKIQKYINSVYLIFMLYVLRQRMIRLKYPGALTKIWRALLYFMTFGQFASGFSVVGVRYMLVANTFLVLFLFRMYAHSPTSGTLNNLIIWRFVFSGIGFAANIYNIWCVVYHELFWAPLPIIIDKGLLY